VYSNCDEIELFVNGKSIGKRRPDTDKDSGNLKHPPFTFNPSSYHAGKLSAVGYINGKKVIEQVQRTPEAPAAITLRADESGRALKSGQNDIVLCMLRLGIPTEL